jgi:DNA-binding CsgD family transcriptional regulator
MLAGRDAEVAAVQALLEQARDGRGGGLLLHGLPGVGKSFLLAHAADLAAAEGMRVLRTQGVESESPLPFAALHRLLRPLAGLVDRLPAPQARALRSAFGESEDDDTSDRFRTFLATLTLMAEAADQSPVLAVVDDAHWLDDASAAALSFVARRLDVERVAVLFGARDGDVRAFDSGDLPSIAVESISVAAAGALLSELAGVPVPTDVRDRIVTSTGGNVLALVELAGALQPDQLRGLAPLPERLPITDGVERAFLDRYRRLSAPARTLLRVVAADDSGRARVVQQASAELGVGADAIDEVERSGLLQVRDGEVQLRHPLVRSAVYEAATSSERRAAHAALAGALSDEVDADRRAWHRAAAADQPDDTVVDELDAAARRAVRRGGHEAASAAWVRAAELSRDEQVRARHLFRAAGSSWLAGLPGRGKALAESASAHASDPLLRADIARLRARIEWNTGSLDLGHRMVLEAARDVAPHDAVRARELALFAAALSTVGATTCSIDATGFAGRDTATSPREKAIAALMLGLDRVSRHDWVGATPLLRSAFELGEPVAVDDHDLLPNLGVAAMQLGDDEVWQRLHERLLSRAQQTGQPVMALYALTRLAPLQLVRGRWTSASATASEALELAAGTGQPGLTSMPLATLGVLAALRGHAGVPEQLLEAERVLAAHPAGTLRGWVLDVVRWGKAVSADDPGSAVHHLQQISPSLALPLAALDRIDAAVRAARVDLARVWVEELASFADATGMAWAGAGAEHGRALLTEGDEAAQHFEEALRLHASSGRPFDRARTALAYGEHLRRARRRVDAREHLRAALQVFDDLGATAWADRAATELRASGQTARKRDVTTVATALTPQELNVARLVQQGMANRDVAGQLFLSPRTVDFHLRNVFAKLGVTSRVELAAQPLA